MAPGPYELAMGRALGSAAQMEEGVPLVDHGLVVDAEDKAVKGAFSFLLALAWVSVTSPKGWPLVTRCPFSTWGMNIPALGARTHRVCWSWRENYGTGQFTNEI